MSSRFAIGKVLSNFQQTININNIFNKYNKIVNRNKFDNLIIRTMLTF